MGRSNSIASLEVRNLPHLVKAVGMLGFELGYIRNVKVNLTDDESSPT